MILSKVMNRDVSCFLSHLWSVGRMQQLPVVLSRVHWEALWASEKKTKNCMTVFVNAERKKRRKKSPRIILEDRRTPTEGGGHKQIRHGDTVHMSQTGHCERASFSTPSWCSTNSFVLCLFFINFSFTATLYYIYVCTECSLTSQKGLIIQGKQCGLL